MKTAKQWFRCLRPDLRDRAIKATKVKDMFYPNGLNQTYKTFSDALITSFCWNDEEFSDLWSDVHDEALKIESGKKPDIK